jgi:hypothetical protein
MGLVLFFVVVEGLSGGEGGEVVLWFLRLSFLFL